MVSVCPGEELLLTCISNQSITLRWAITIPDPERNVTRSRLVPNTGSRVLTPIRETLNHNDTVTFMFTRTSEDGMLPLISHLAIGKTTNHLNGTEIHCSSSNTHITFLVHIQGSKYSIIIITNCKHFQFTLTLMLHAALILSS